MAAQAMALEPASSRYRRAYAAARDAARDATGGAGRGGLGTGRHGVGEEAITAAHQDEDVLSLVWVDGGELDQAVAAAFGPHVLPSSLHVSLPRDALDREGALRGDGIMAQEGSGKHGRDGDDLVHGAAGGRRCEVSGEHGTDQRLYAGAAVATSRHGNEAGEREGENHAVPQVARVATPAVQWQNEEDGEPQAAGWGECSTEIGRDHGQAAHVRDRDMLLEQSGLLILEEEESVGDTDEAADGVHTGELATKEAARQPARGGEVEDVAVEGEDYYEMYVAPE